MRTHLVVLTLLACPALALLAPASPAQTTMHAFQGTQGSESHGYSVANAGDVDGDGFDDVIVGSPFYDKFVFPTTLLVDAGRATVRSGATGATLFSITGVATDERFGFDVDGAGDVNADGFADVVIGVPGRDLAGMVSGGFAVYLGPDGVLDWAFTQDAPLTTNFGWSVAGCGDANGDGFDDVVIGSPFDATLSWVPDTGEVRVYDVFNQGLIALFTGGESNAHLGWSVDGAGDVDGDGLADVIVGAPHDDTSSPVFVDAGQVIVLSPATSTMQPLLWLDGGQHAGAEFGYSVSGGGLVDFDGVPDIIVGAPGRSGDTGRVSVHSGATGSFLSLVSGTNSGERFGAAVAGGGDFDRDGLLDYIAGAPSYDVPPLGVNRGRIEVRTADTGDLLHTATSLGGGQIGFAVDMGAHTDIDGRAEIIYGAPYNDTAATNAGASFVVSSSNAFAAWSNYGTGLAGTLGVPTLEVDGSPSLGTVMSMVLGSSAPATAPGILAVGIAPQAVAFKGGSMLVVPLLQIGVSVPTGTTALPFLVPSAPLLLGADTYVQLWMADTGAPVNVAMSPGLQLTFGE